MTCAKARVTCTIRVGLVTVVGENWCGNPQQQCPRLAGEDYAKCKTVCQQVGHAEMDAIDKARAAGLALRGSTAVLDGHTYMCRTCQEALWDAGVLNLQRAAANTRGPRRLFTGLVGEA